MNSDKIVFVRPADAISPRLFKLTDICRGIFSDVIFLGADRSKQETVNNYEGVDFRKIGIFYPYSSLKYILGTVIFVFAAIRQMIIERPLVVHSSDLEGAVPGYLYKMIFPKSYLIINVHDNFFARYKLSERKKSFLKWVEARVYKKADMLLFPDDNRIKIFKPYKFKNTWCIPNTPEDPGYEEPGKSNGIIKLFIAGFISTVRGLDQFIALAEKYDDVELHFVGRCSDDDMKKIINCKRAVYHGRRSQKDTLQIGKSCHVLPIYYEPNKEIHVYASPNKLFDAFALGRPVVMNTGINVTSFVSNYNMGELVDYYDVDSLHEALHRIVDDYDAFIHRSKRIRSAYEEEFRWKRYQTELIDFFRKIRDR